MTKKSKKWLKDYKQSDYKKNRTLEIRKRYISSDKDKMLKNFQRWLATRNGKIFRIVIIFWILQIIWFGFIA